MLGKISLVIKVVLRTDLTIIGSASTLGINATATVFDHNGNDITSSFIVMVYHQPSTTPYITGTGNELENPCPAGEMFINSHCDPEAGGDNAMQKYIYTCRRIESTYSAVTGMATGTRPVFHIKHGDCNPFEVCITTRRPRLLATCVDSFDEYTIKNDGVIRPKLAGATFNLEEMTMYAAVSEDDRSTPLPLDKLNVAALAENINVQNKTCIDCVDMSTDTFGPKTDSLKVEATLLTTSAMAGILWLGFLSG